MGLRVAAVAWRLRRIRTETEFADHLRECVEAACVGETQLVVLPELFVLELLGALGEVAEGNVPNALAEYAPLLEAWIQTLARSHGITLVGGSHFAKGAGGVENVCVTASPNGSSRHPKNLLTRYERDVWGLVPGQILRTNPELGLGVAICYDLEFPGSVRALAEHGARVVAAPSFTETKHGYHRVRQAAHARALENHVFVLHAALVGSLGREPVPSTYGSAAIVAPNHPPFPADGVLAATHAHREEIAFAELDLEALARTRSEGTVTNWDDRGHGWAVEVSRER
ncbi:MAG: hypothetical protein H6534_04220 [Chthonomonadaceae bacterium]|nr:hypothetical protein [Chthonomonadaceae bacterium]